MSNPAWFKYCWYWEKPKGSNFQLTKYQPLRVIEEICVFSNGGTSASSTNPAKYYPQTEKRERARVRDLRNSPNRARSETANLARNTFTVVTHTDWQPRNLLYAVTDSEKGLHPTQKPVALLAYLIRTYTNKGETVLDNVMGSGSTGAACIEEGRDFIGIEKDAEYFKIASKRLEYEQTKPRTLRMEMT
jgi:site-specific DNA-methyltransferase (adenine-specific)